MSQQVLEERVGHLENRFGDLNAEVARQGQALGHVRDELRSVGDGVKTLVDRDARRGEALSFRSVAATCGGLAAIAVVVWWLIGASPAVQSLERRLDHAEWKYGWMGRVERGE